MNIVFFDLATIDYPGGCEKYFANLAKYMSKEHFVSCYGSTWYNKFMNYIYFIVSRRKISPVIYLKRDIGKGIEVDIQLASFIPSSEANRELKKRLFAADVIYAKNEFQELALLYCLLGKKEYKKRVIVGVHTPIFVPSQVKGIWKVIHDLEYNSFLYKKFLTNARFVHVNNKDYIGLISKSYKIQKEQIVYIPNPIDWDTQLAKDKHEGFSIVWAGRLTQQKGLDRLAKIIEKLSYEKDFKQISFIIAGDGEARQAIEEIANKYQNVKYVGFIKDIEGIYSQVDLSIFTAYFDTFAHAVLEPLSYGIPVVSYDIPGPRDMIVNGENGFLVSNEEEFCKKIHELYNSKKKDSRMYNSFRKDIFLGTNKRYSKQKVFGELDQLFSKGAHSI